MTLCLATSSNLRLVAVGSADKLLAAWTCGYNVIVRLQKLQLVQPYCDGATIMRWARHDCGSRCVLQLPPPPSNEQEQRSCGSALEFEVFGKVVLTWSVVVGSEGLVLEKQECVCAKTAVVANGKRQ